MVTTAIWLISCTTEQTEETNTNRKEINLEGTSKVFPDINTRTQTGAISEDGSLCILWSVGDKIGVFSDVSENNVIFTSSNSIPSGTTTFKGALKGSPMYAYYPYAKEKTNVANIPVSIPTKQIYANENSISQYDIKATNSITKQIDGSYKLNLRQMASLVRFEIKLNDVNGFTLTEGETLQRVELQTSAPVTGEFTMNLTNLDAGLNAATGTTPAKQLNIQFANTPLLTNSIIAYAIVAPGTQLDTEWECVIVTDKHRIEFITKVHCNLEAGKFHTIPLNATVLANGYHYNEHGNQISGPIIEEIIPEETANCYIVSTPGSYSFDATIIGNGPKGIIPNVDFHTTTATITPQSAKLLWQDINGFIADVSLDANGRVNYIATGNTGNAMIAVYSGANGTGEILWSWHIWGIGNEPLMDEIYTNKAGANFTVMDRTLGAHSKTSYYATLYQWGRKDPFPNSTTYYVNNTATDIEKSYPTYTTETDINASIKNPDKLLNANVNAGVWNWSAINNNYLWGDTDIRDSYTWFSNGKYTNSEAGAGWTNEKTIYDPCPAGYRVANKFTWTGFVRNTDGNNSSTTTNSRLEYINYTKYENGYYFKKDENDAIGTYYPMTGNRGAANGSLWTGTGKSAYNTLNYTASYYSSAPQKNAHQAQTLSISPYNAGSSAVESSQNAVNATNFSYKWTAFPVRCVRGK